MIVLGKRAYYLGIYVHQRENGDIHLHRLTYIQQAVERVELTGAGLFNIPRIPVLNCSRTQAQRGY